jgi:hypothetical protein
MLKIEEARDEIASKTHRQIEEETAWKWASRAAASYELVSNKGEDKLAIWSMAEDFYHEAIEHAALVEKESDDEGEELVAKVRKAVSPYIDKAVEAMDKALKG